jgi:hypothetical protein
VDAIRKQGIPRLTGVRVRFFNTGTADGVQVVRTVACALLLFATTGCGFTEAKQKGEGLAEQYFASAQQGDTTSVLALYDDAFYKATPEPKWREMYGHIRKKLGKPQSHTLANWNVNSMTGTSGSGQYVTLVYQVQYEAATGTETIGVFIPSGNGRTGIRKHFFNSDALVQ